MDKVVEEFWKKWLKKNTLEREVSVEKFYPLFSEYFRPSGKKENIKLMKNAFGNFLNAYFEDFMEFLESRQKDQKK